MGKSFLFVAMAMVTSRSGRPAEWASPPRVRAALEAFHLWALISATVSSLTPSDILRHLLRAQATPLGASP